MRNMSKSDAVHGFAPFINVRLVQVAIEALFVSLLYMDIVKLTPRAQTGNVGQPKDFEGKKDVRFSFQNSGRT